MTESLTTDVPAAPLLAITMTMSPTIGKLTTALAAAQAEFVPPKKTKHVNVRSTKGAASSFNYSYAPLEEVIAAVKPLSKHGIAFTQLVVRTPSGGPGLATYLLCGDEWLMSLCPLPAATTGQELSSSITYAKRICLSAITGIAGEDDDDGRSATDTQDRRPRDTQEADHLPAREKTGLKAAAAAGRVESAHDGHAITPAEVDRKLGERVTKLCDMSGVKQEELLLILAEKGYVKQDVAMSAQLTVELVDAVEANWDKIVDQIKALRKDTEFPPMVASAFHVRMFHLLQEAGLSPDDLHLYYTAAGHMPESVRPEDLPPDYVEQLTEPKNWTKVVKAIKGGK